MFARTALRRFSPLSQPQHRVQQVRRLNFVRRAKSTTENGEPVKIYRVKFVREPLLSWRRMRRLALYAGGAALFWNYVVTEFITISFEELEEEAVGEDGPEVVGEEEDDHDEMGLFIPMGWPKKQERTWYKASDPEWKEFVKFSKDPERHKEVQKRLVTAIRSEIAGHPNVKRILGDIAQDKGRYWLEIIFPDGPPQEYSVPGIEINDDFIAWSVKNVSQKDYAALYRLLVPTATIKASWASFKYQFDLQANKVREALGMQPKFDAEVLMVKAHLAHQRMKDGQQKRLDGSREKSHPQGSIQKGLPPPPPLLPGAEAVPKGDATKEDSSAEPLVPGLPSLPSIVPRGEEHPVTLALFMQSLKKNRQPTPIEPPRGNLVVSGLIEIIGTRGRTTLDVSAAFDPVSNQYTAWSYNPRRIQPRAQRPRGGP